MGMVSGLERRLQQQCPDESYRSVKWVVPRAPRWQLVLHHGVLPFIDSHQLLSRVPHQLPRFPFGPLSYNALQKKVLSASDARAGRLGAGSTQARTARAEREGQTEKFGCADKILKKIRKLQLQKQKEHIWKKIPLQTIYRSTD